MPTPEDTTPQTPPSRPRTPPGGGERAAGRARGGTDAQAPNGPGRARRGTRRPQRRRAVEQPTEVIPPRRSPRAGQAAPPAAPAGEPRGGRLPPGRAGLRALPPRPARRGGHAPPRRRGRPARRHRPRHRCPARRDRPRAQAAPGSGSGRASWATASPAGALPGRGALLLAVRHPARAGVRGRRAGHGDHHPGRRDAPEDGTR